MKKKTKTQKKYRNLQIVRWSLYSGTYLIPLVPAGIMLGINWEEWFSKDQWSIGLGFGMLLLTILITILGIAKKDEVVKKNVSALFYFAGLMSLWAVSLMFLASIANEFGYMLLYTACGLLGGATCEQINKTKIIKEVDQYKKILIQSGLKKEKNNYNEILERAKKEKEEIESAQERAVD